MHMQVPCDEGQPTAWQGASGGKGWSKWLNVQHQVIKFLGLSVAIMSQPLGVGDPSEPAGPAVHVSCSFRECALAKG
jgi:hypothetical protein